MHGYRTSNRFSALYQVLADTGPASFKADYRPATAGRAVPATPRRQSVSCNDTPFDGLRRAGRRSGKGGAVPTSYTHIHRARQRFAMPSRAYPELFAVLGNSVPDLRGLFLRGHGARTSSHYGTVLHRSGELGMIQGDAIRNITGSSGDSPNSGAYYYGALAGGAGGARKFAGEGLRGRSAINFDASRVVPTAEENRPVNTAVRYLIRPGPEPLAKQAWRRYLKREPRSLL